MTAFQRGQWNSSLAHLTLIIMLGVSFQMYAYCEHFLFPLSMYKTSDSHFLNHQKENKGDGFNSSGVMVYVAVLQTGQGVFHSQLTWPFSVFASSFLTPLC